MKEVFVNYLFLWNSLFLLNSGTNKKWEVASLSSTGYWINYPWPQLFVWQYKYSLFWLFCSSFHLRCIFHGSPKLKPTFYVYFPQNEVPSFKMLEQPCICFEMHRFFFCICHKWKKVVKSTTVVSMKKTIFKTCFSV